MVLVVDGPAYSRERMHAREFLDEAQEVALELDGAVPGLDSADAGKANGASSGCSCSTAQDGKPTVLLAFLVLGLGIARRRSRR